MRIAEKVFSIFLLLAALSAPAFGNETVSAKPVDYTFEPVLSLKWSAYLKGGDLYIMKTGSSPVLVRAFKEAEATITHPAMTSHGDIAYISWIEKGPGGNSILFASSGRNFKPLIIAAGTNSLYVKTLAIDENNVFVLDIYQGQEPKVFLSLSSDGGDTFKRLPLTTDGMEALFYPTLAATEKALYVFYHFVKLKEEYFGLQSFEIPSMKASEPLTIARTGPISLIDAFPINGSPVAIYKTVREDGFHLEIAQERLNGWETRSIKLAEKLDVARIDHHVWDNGRALIVLSAEERRMFKQRIYAAISTDGGRTWDSQRIDAKEFDNTRSWLPRMAVSGDRVAVVWEDSRDIRARVRMKVSTDRGKTWLKTDVPISSLKHYSMRPRITSTGEDLNITWHRFVSDEKMMAETVLMKMSWNEAVKLAMKKEKTISLKKKKKLLLKSVKRYWKAMVKANHKTTYRLHDPFFRARIPFDYYMSHRGSIVYNSYEILDAEIKGNEAIVKSTVNYEVPKLKISGRETTVPPTDFPILDTWLFIDGKWYRKFVDPMSEGNAIKY